MEIWDESRYVTIQLEMRTVMAGRVGSRYCMSSEELTGRQESIDGRKRVRGYVVIVAVPWAVAVGKSRSSARSCRVVLAGAAEKWA